LEEIVFMSPAPVLPQEASVEPTEDEQPLIRVYEKPEATWEVITPATAQAYLDTMERNRAEKISGTDAYGRDMENDEWLVTGETIVFDWFDRLIDGQHRLKAVVKSGKSIDALVVRGIDPKAQNRMDGGIRRTFRDQLTLDGVVGAPALAALLRRIYLWKPPYNERVNFSRITVTNAELEGVLNEYRYLPDVVAYITPLAAKAEVSKSLMSFLFWLFAQKNQERAVEFVEKWANGTGLEEGDPILALIRRLRSERRRADSQGSRGSLQTMTIWLAVYAWNAYSKNRSISGLQLPRGGIKAENFPRIAE
jgi:hypothetical protein